MQTALLLGSIVPGQDDMLQPDAQYSQTAELPLGQSGSVAPQPQSQPSAVP